ncbi:hypothetical protein CF336_g4893 [Tilletia laevis]|nr:hypothetical protein CF336_g4893 [Tilletia laevis]
MSDNKITSVETMRKAVPEFDGTNWKDFAFSVRTTLKGNGCFPTLRPDAANDKQVGRPAAQPLSIYEEERALMREKEQDAKERQDAAFAVFQRSPVSRSGGEQAPRGSKPGGARSSTKNSGPFPHKCWDCQQKGHTRSECPYAEQFDALRKKANPQQTQDTAAAASDAFSGSAPPVLAPVAVDPADFDFDYAFIAVSPDSVGSNDFILDTAAARHIVSDASHLVGFKKAPKDAGIRCADGGLMPVTGYGDLTVLNISGERIKLRDVAHFPSVVGNLIGGKRLTSSGFRITFDDQEASVVHTGSGKTILKAQNNGQNWVVTLSPVPADKALVVGAVEVDPKAAYFHNCTGHCGQRRLETLAKSGRIIGMPSTIGSIGFCSACAAGVPQRH